MSFFRKLFGKKNTSKNNNTADMSNALNQGGPKIMISMHMFVKLMTQHDPRWEGLFHFSGKDDYAEVLCYRGFADRNTAEIMPQLWQRRSFIENCRIFGCNEIRFNDALTGNQRVIKIADIDETKLP